jgi:hypothetical protein
VTGWRCFDLGGDRNCSPVDLCYTVDRAWHRVIHGKASFPRLAFISISSSLV